MGAFNERANGQRPSNLCTYTQYCVMVPAPLVASVESPPPRRSRPRRAGRPSTVLPGPRVVFKRMETENTRRP